MSENKEQVYEVESLDQKVEGLTGCVIKCRLAKDKRNAERIMVVFSVCCLAISFYLFAKTANVL